MATAADFYDRLAPFFDVMTDWEARLAFEGLFWRQLFARHSTRSVLDTACGTGGHTLEFARWGLRTAGADLSPRMLELARSKAAAAGLDVPFVQASFADLPRHFTSEFDAVLCVGNSLPHVLTGDELEAALRGMRGILRAGGVLVIQNLNYDRRWRERPRFFGLSSGVLEGHEALVWRLADYHDTHPPGITFHTALFEKGDGGQWTVEVNSTPQRPWFRDELVKRLAAMGLVVGAAYGGFDAAPFDPLTSPDLVLVARK
jgi:glycine/sarcosine N-methyltransferase